MTQCATRVRSALMLVALALPVPLAAQTGSVEIWMKAFTPDPDSLVETKFILIPTGHGTAIVRAAAQGTSGDISTPTVRDGAAHVNGQVMSISIDYSFDLRWQPFPGALTANVNISESPMFEMYARAPGHEWIEVVRGRGSGTSVTQLSEAVTLPVLDGIWESDDAQRRFLLKIRGTSVAWTERDAAGGELTRQLPMWFGDDAATISRANDAEVLAFLGFQPELRQQILARAPIPSFITLTIDEHGLLAEWFGVLAIKDKQDQLKTLVQPGDRKPKRFRLQRRSSP